MEPQDWAGEILRTARAWRDARREYDEAGQGLDLTDDGDASWAYTYLPPLQFAEAEAQASFWTVVELALRRVDEAVAPASVFGPTTRVVHPKFGPGVVLKSEYVPSGHDVDYTIRFDTGKVATLSHTFARLQREQTFVRLRKEEE